MGGPYKYGVFATRLREATDAAGLTQGELAANLGVKQQAVSKWMTGTTRPRPATLRRLADLVGWSSTEALEVAGYLDEDPTDRGSEDRPPTVQERLRALEITVAAQDRKLDEILGLLRGVGGSR